MKIAVPDYPTITDLKAIQAQLVSSRGNDVEIDVSDVTRLGGQLIQLLICAACTWQKGSAKFALSGMTASFDKTLELIGLDKKLLQANVG